MILDVVLGGGQHQIESALHLHPEAGEVEVAALGPHAALCESAPLHECVGETRPMTRHRLAVEARLPWWDGWRVGELARALVLRAAFEGGDLRLVLGEPLPLELVWRPGSADPAHALHLALPAPPGDAN